MGDLNQAMVHFEDALDFCRRAGYRPVLALICCDYADTLLQRNESGDHEKAMNLLDESLAISSELGMRPLMERVLSPAGDTQGVNPIWIKPRRIQATKEFNYDNPGKMDYGSRLPAGMQLRLRLPL